ncbi:DUF2244 domain-containing protein [Roseobacter weihaiensis]|uniref:DUF2244 domain-containing protein n=1 Tax=Roseobacter weihaiensis TaxID=2763262 RepID=UPI001D0B8AE8|nr:DUF2244 domain-containing protein [Roseobacter sp. H9]
MPYQWTSEPGEVPQTLRLWPHQSLPARGMAAFILATFAMILIPVVTLLGSPVLWGLLPFALLAVWGMYHALQRNHHARRIVEVLTLDTEAAQLVRTEPSGAVKEWDCNRYWTTIKKYEKDGPIPHYVTLQGMGREVEIGAFLSEEERVALYDELQRAWRR